MPRLAIYGDYSAAGDGEDGSGYSFNSKNISMEEGGDQLQLHDEAEDVPKKRYHSKDITMKLEAIEWARNTTISSASKIFGVDRKMIKSWMKKELDLRRQR